MNEVARCTQIVLGIAAASAGSAGPVALVDLGTGAGLGLQLDRYRYRVGTAMYSPAEAGLTLACEVRGPIVPPPPDLPPISDRIGVDLDPVDLGDPAARAWLQACAPPEASALSRLAVAMDIARRHPARIIAGDAVDVLPRVLASIPAQQRVTVVDAYTAVFLPKQRRAELAGVLAEAARARPVTWVSLDPLVPLGPACGDSVQGVPLPDALIRDYQRDGVLRRTGSPHLCRGSATAGAFSHALTHPASGSNGSAHDPPFCEHPPSSAGERGPPASTTLDRRTESETRQSTRQSSPPARCPANLVSRRALLSRSPPACCLTFETIEDDLRPGRSASTTRPTDAVPGARTKQSSCPDGQRAPYRRFRARHLPGDGACRCIRIIRLCTHDEDNDPGCNCAAPSPSPAPGRPGIAIRS